MPLRDLRERGAHHRDVERARHARLVDRAGDGLLRLPQSRRRPVDRAVEPDDAAVGEVHERGAHDREPGLVEQSADAPGHATRLRELAPQRVVEHLDATATHAFGAVRGHVGVRQQLIDRHGVVTRRTCDPDAGSDEHLVAVHVVGLVQGVEQSFRERERACGRVDCGGGGTGVVDHGTAHHELVAAQTNAEVAAAQGVAEPLGDLHEQLVAGRVAEHVVDALEAVQVDEEERDVGATAAPAGQRGGQFLDEERPAPEAGQAVVGRVVFEPSLEPLAFRHVLERPEEALHRAPRSAQRDGAHADPARRAVGDRDAQLARGRGRGSLALPRRLLLLPESLHVVGPYHRRPPPAQRLLGRKPGQPRERRVHERAAVVEIDLEDADRALGHERAPAGFTIEDGLVDGPDDGSPHVRVIEEVAEPEGHVVPAVVVVVDADAGRDVDRGREPAALQGVTDEPEIVAVHPVGDPRVRVGHTVPARKAAQAAQHDAGPQVGAEDRDRVGEGAHHFGFAYV